MRGEGLWAELVCETPLEHWGIALEAFGLVVEPDATDHERGERVPVGLDLEWEVDDAALPTDLERPYTQLGHIRGELLIGSERLTIDAPASRAHSWSVSDG